MKKKTRFFLPIYTTPELFCKWVERRIHETINRQFDTENGYSKIHPEIKIFTGRTGRQFIHVSLDLYGAMVETDEPYHIFTFITEQPSGLSNMNDRIEVL